MSKTDKVEVRVCLVGATGRMGVEIAQAAERRGAEGFSIAIGLVEEGNQGLSPNSGSGFQLSSVWKDGCGANVIVDFSSPEGTKKALRVAKEQRLPILVATTGLGAEFDELIAEAAKVTAVVRASNTSVGVNAMLELVAQATKLLGESYDIELVETHHKMKKDAPSGTALSLLKSIADARGVELKSVLTEGRSGLGERKPGEIGVQAIRGGDVAGEHTVFYFGDGERIEITHRATKRAIFAEGALQAARWLVQRKKPGLYSMRDVLAS